MHKPKINATITDVARKAGVSIYTVSRVANNKGGVSKKSEEKVRAAIALLDYRPNSIARALKKRSTQSMGLIIPSIENPVFPPLVKVIEDTANRYGFSMVLCTSDGELEKESKQINLLIEKQVDGILFNAMGQYHEGFEILRKIRMPVVVIGRKIQGFATANVSVSNLGGAFRAVEHLISSGCQDIAVVLGGLEASSAIADRFEGYKNALHKHGLAYREELVVKGAWSFEGGIAAAEELLRRQVRFDAVFASNDMVAMGCIEKLLEKGIKIPDQVGVIGYDDIPFSRMIRPHLSTVRAPNLKFGVEAVKFLLRIIHTGKDTHQEVLFDPELVIRESTKNLAMGT